MIHYSTASLDEENSNIKKLQATKVEIAMNQPNQSAYNMIVRRIHEPCGAMSLNPNDVQLCAVSKIKSVEAIKVVYDQGCRIFGESYVQEALPKIAQLPSDISWHFIGHLQSNKAKLIAGKFELIHCVDSLNLLTEIDKRSAAIGVVQNILIEIKLDPSPTKHGVEFADMPQLVEKANEMSNVRLNGLMGLPPFNPEPEASRSYFKLMKQAFESLPANNQRVLSMGMSNDFEIAIEEGSNLVRVGTAIFGLRDVNS